MQQELKRKVRIAAGNFQNLYLLRSFFNPSLLSFMFIAHKYLRWISPVFLFLLTILLMVMSIYSLSACILLILLISSYFITYMKYDGIQNFMTNNLARIFSYFYITVWAQWLGYMKFKSKKQGAVWDTIRQ